MARSKKWLIENVNKILGIISAFAVLLAFVYCPLTVYKAEDSCIVELGIEENFVANYNLVNLRGKWSTDSFYYKRPAECEQYTFWYIVKSYSSTRYYCICTNTPLEIRQGSNPYLDIMLNWNSSGIAFDSGSCLLESTDGVNWTNHGAFDQLTIGAYNKNTYKYYWTYLLCESNYYTFSATDGNNWNNGSYVYMASPIVRADNVMDFCGVLNVLSLPMPSTVNAAASYNVLYKSGDVYILDSFTTNDIRVDIAHASGSVPWSESAIEGYMPLYSCEDGYYRNCLYYYNGAWSEYYSGISVNDTNINLIIENDLISSLDNFVYSSDFIVYSDFDVYRSAEVLSGVDLADYGVPYVMYDVATGSYIEGSTPPENEPDSGTENEPDSGTDSGSSDDEYNGELDSEFSDALDKSSELDDVVADAEYTKPDIDKIDTDISDMVSDDDIKQVTDLLSILTERNLIKDFLLISFTICLVGYVFFGKR